MLNRWDHSQVKVNWVLWIKTGHRLNRFKRQQFMHARRQKAMTNNGKLISHAMRCIMTASAAWFKQCRDSHHSGVKQRQSFGFFGAGKKRIFKHFRYSELFVSNAILCTDERRMFCFVHGENKLETKTARLHFPNKPFCVSVRSTSLPRPHIRFIMYECTFGGSLPCVCINITKKSLQD